MSYKPKYIVHVDMDAFFASVEQRDDPSLRGRPVIVGSDPKGGRGRGVVAACSYEARAFGIHSAMPISIAYKKCPHAAFLRGSMHKYADESDRIFDILQTFTPDIEPISIDEAFLDITGTCGIFGSPEKTCDKIKSSIKEITGLTASLGMAPNKMTAKIASDLKKPDGLVIVKKEELLDFLHPLPVSRLWGVGEQTDKVFKRSGIRTIGQLASHDPEKLRELFGKNGIHIWELANGIDERSVETESVARSISNEHTFDKDTCDLEHIQNTLMRLCEKVSHRLRNNGFKCTTITLKIRLSDFRTFTRSVTIDHPTNFISDLYSNCFKKLEPFEAKNNPVRLIGVKASNFSDTAWDTDLFNDSAERSVKIERIHQTLDRIKDRFGERSIGFRGV